MRSAFSLVELSIVLVILGLLAGGILGGQSLMHAAELRATTTQLSHYHSAVMTFRDKYFAIPGDMTNATQFWGDNDSFCADAAIADGTPGTCNGNGSGYIEAPNAGAPYNQGQNGSAEKYQFWVQLAYAGLIEGSYTGIDSGCGSFGWCAVAGENSPASKYGNNTVIDMNGYFGSYAAAYSYYFPELNGVNRFTIRRNNNVGGGDSGVMPPEDAWNMDTKLDDGKPARGKFRVGSHSQIAGDCTLAASDTDYDAGYALEVTELTCAPTYIVQ